MFSNVIGTGLTLTKVISGLSKTVNIVKEVIPIYENVKPMLGNTKKILKYFHQQRSKGNGFRKRFYRFE